MAAMKSRLSPLYDVLNKSPDCDVIDNIGREGREERGGGHGRGEGLFT